MKRANKVPVTDDRITGITMVKKLKCGDGWEYGLDAAGNVRTHLGGDSWFIVLTASMVRALATGKGEIPVTTVKKYASEIWNVKRREDGGVTIGCQTIDADLLKSIAKQSAALAGGKALKFAKAEPTYYKEFTSEAGRALAINLKGDVVDMGENPGEYEPEITLKADTLDKLAAAAVLVGKVQVVWEAAKKALDRLPSFTDCGNHSINNAGDCDNGCVGDIMDAFDDNEMSFNFAIGCNPVSLKELAMVHALSKRARASKRK